MSAGPPPPPRGSHAGAAPLRQDCPRAPRETKPQTWSGHCGTFPTQIASSPSTITQLLSGNGRFEPKVLKRQSQCPLPKSLKPDLHPTTPWASESPGEAGARPGEPGLLFFLTIPPGDSDGCPWFKTTPSTKSPPTAPSSTSFPQSPPGPATVHVTFRLLCSAMHPGCLDERPGHRQACVFKEQPQI